MEMMQHIDSFSFFENHQFIAHISHLDWDEL
jgi:hypothetical protein